jgi:multicomponent Na+:H+ antiporter subunit E
MDENEVFKNNTVSNCNSDIFFNMFILQKTNTAELMGRISVLSLLLSFLSLMAFWLIMSGFFDILHISYGIVSVAVVLAVNFKLKTHRFFEDEMDDLLHLRFGNVIVYIPWILLQILKSGFHVAFIILRPSKPVQPALLKFRVDLPSAHAKMILGNSITLTPGTLTIDIKGNEFTVHALSETSYAGIVNDAMPRKVRGLFVKDSKPVISDVEIITEQKSL